MRRCGSSATACPVAFAPTLSTLKISRGDRRDVYASPPDATHGSCAHPRLSRPRQRSPWARRHDNNARSAGVDGRTLRAVIERTEHRDAPSSASTKPSPKSAPDSSNRFCSHPEGTGNGAALSSIRKLPLPQHRSLLLPRCRAHEVHQLLGKRVTPEAWAKNCPVLCYKRQSRVKSAGVTLKISENRTDILRNAA